MLLLIDFSKSSMILFNVLIKNQIGSVSSTGPKSGSIYVIEP